jgi:hypothetical protein
VNDCWDDEELESGGVSWAMAVLMVSSAIVVGIEDSGRLTRENRRGQLGFRDLDEERCVVVQVRSVRTGKDDREFLVVRE